MKMPLKIYFQKVPIKIHLHTMLMIKGSDSIYIAIGYIDCQYIARRASEQTCQSNVQLSIHQLNTSTEILCSSHTCTNSFLSTSFGWSTKCK